MEQKIKKLKKTFNDISILVGNFWHVGNSLSGFSAFCNVRNLWLIVLCQNKLILNKLLSLSVEIDGANCGTQLKILMTSLPEHFCNQYFNI